MLINMAFNYQNLLNEIDAQDYRTSETTALC